MDTINIYNPDNSLFKAQAVSADCMYRNELQGEESVELKWEGHEYEQIPAGAYIEYDSRRFRLDEPHEPSRRTEDVFTFNPVFYSEPHHWRKAQACYYEYGSSDVQYSDTMADNQHTIALTTLPTPTGVELDWSFTGNLPDAMSMILQAIKNETGATWNARYGSEIATTLIEISAQGLSVFDFISQVAEQCGKEFYFDFSNSTPVVCIGTLEIQAQGTHTEDGRVLLNVGDDVANPSVQSDADEYFTRFYFFGSNRNIVQPNSITKSSVVNRRLPLLPTATTGRHSYPKGFIDINRTPQSYDANGVYQPTLPPYKVYAKSVFFDDIYPHSDLKIKTVQTRHIAVEDDSGAPTGENMPIFYITLKDGSGNDFVFNNDTYDEQHPNGHRMPGLVPSVAFRSGYLQGLEYELYYHDEDFSVSTTGSEGQGGYVTIHAPCFEVIFDTNSNPRLPNDTIKPQVNDECTLFNIKMPNEYILTAQAELEEKALDYIADLNVDKSTYTTNSNPVRFDSITALKELRVGTLAKMIYPSGTEVQSRVIKIEKHLDFPCECTVTLGYKATQGTLTTLRETIADTSEKTETVIKSGEKNKAQILGLRNGYRAQKETFDKAFDTDGYFDGSRIKPLTVETNALSVGSRSQQFTLSGVQLSVDKYTTGNGTLSWDCTNGKLAHLSLDEDYILVWPMATGSQALNDANSHYIYAKVAKDGFGAASGGIKTNSNSGTFVATAEQKKFDSDQNHYYFLVGTISSVQTDSDSTFKTRIISLTYGTTTINGKQIQTGVIRSSDGSSVVIDLDNGTLTGKIRFLSNNTPVDAEQYINNTVGDEISGLGIDGTNLLAIDQNKWEQGSWTATGAHIDITLRIRNTKGGNYLRVEAGTTYTISRHTDVGASKTYHVVLYAYDSNGNYVLSDSKIEWQSTFPFTWTPQTATRLEIGIRHSDDSTITVDEAGIAKIKIEKGETATAWTLSSEDVQGGIDAISNMEIGGKNILRKSKSISSLGPNTQHAPWAEGKWRNSGAGTATRTIIMEGVSNYPTNAPAATNILQIVSTSASSGETSISQNLITAMVVGERYVLSFFARATSGSPKIFIQLNSGSYGGVVDSSTIATSAWKQYSVSCIYTQEQANAGGGSIYVGHYSSVGTIQICGIKLEKGNKPTDWTPAPEDTDYLRNALNEATSGSTEILGGLILTKMIQAGSYDRQAGMAGLESSDVAFWAGGSLNGAAQMAVPIVIKRDGSARLGLWRFSSRGEISMPISGKSRMNITGSSLPPANIDVWQNDYWYKVTSAVSVQLTDTPTNYTLAIPYGNSGKRGYNGMPVYSTGSGYLSFRKTSSGTASLGEVVLKIKTGDTYTDLQKFSLYGSYTDTDWNYEALNFNSISSIYNETDSSSGITLVIYVSGTGTFEFRFTSNNSGAQTGNYGVRVWWASDITVPVTHFANNGLMVLLNNNNYMRVEGSSTALTTTIKGNTDIPGVLWAGRITAAGDVPDTPSFKNVNVTLSKNGTSPSDTSLYNFKYTGISGTPAIMVTPEPTTNTGTGWTAQVISLNTSAKTFSVRIKRDNTSEAAAFHLVIFGTT